MIRVLIMSLVLCTASLSLASEVVHLKLGGTPESFSYISKVLTRALEASGYRVQVENVGNLPTTRLEIMLLNGNLSAFILGETEHRNERYLAVQTGMTANMMGHRILFIQKGSQRDYDDVESLEDFRSRGKVGGMGKFWGDVAIWRANKLPVTTIGGDWKHLYRMVASGQRKVDYLPRGAQEIAREWQRFPDLEVEQNLVFVYPKDHILYVTPQSPELHDLLEVVLCEAKKSGLIQETVRDHYPELDQFPINLGNRRVIKLSSP